MHTKSLIHFITGNALLPVGQGRRILAHVVNDSAPIWGAGFGRGVAQKWPKVQTEFSRWAKRNPEAFKLGAIRLTAANRELIVVQLICQEGYGPRDVRRLRYDKLATCLSSLAQYAISLKAPIHMPKIGTGWAGGDWGAVARLIRARLCDRGILVYVYQLPEGDAK